jgi:nucleotide-binding universal stress UspA family protein
MKKILLPTDFSDNSWNAIKYALQLFKDEECNFYLLNAYTPVIYREEYVLANPTQFDLASDIRESSTEELEEINNRIKGEFNNPKHTFAQISSFNTLIREIKDLQKGNIMDFIVMGTKGATGAKEILFGSNTVHVFKYAKCPVLAIPDVFEFETPHEILFPSDYEMDLKVEHLKPIADIASTYHSRVNILNVSRGYDLTEWQEENKQKLKTYFIKIAHLFHSVRDQTVAEAISNFQLNHRINLLVMINNKHSFFENLFFKSAINQLGFHLNIPFLVIPSQTNFKT